MSCHVSYPCLWAVLNLKKNVTPGNQTQSKDKNKFSSPLPPKQNSITKQNQTIKLVMTAICVIVWHDHKLLQ